MPDVFTKAKRSDVKSRSRSRGWPVLRIWEHALARKNERRCVRRILKWLPPTAVTRTQRRLPMSAPVS